MITYNQIIKAFNTFSTNHKQINTFFSGQEFDFQTNTNIYSAMLVVGDTCNIEMGRFLYNFNIFFIDISNQDGSNSDEIYSDMAQVVGDFVAEFSDNMDLYGFTLEGTVQMNQVFQATDDNTYGWIASISIQVPYTANDCNLPIA
jgi:hypothetical protein